MLDLALSLTESANLEAFHDERVVVLVLAVIFDSGLNEELVAFACAFRDGVSNSAKRNQGNRCDRHAFGSVLILAGVVGRPETNFCALSIARRGHVRICGNAADRVQSEAVHRSLLTSSLSRRWGY